MSRRKEVLAWHWIADNRQTAAYKYRPAVPVEAGQTLVEKRRPLALCAIGLHGSIRALDALGYAPGAVVCRTRHSGAMKFGTDKLCSSKRTVLAMAGAGPLLHEFACWCAETTLMREREAGREPDPRSWAAIEAKRRWLKGEITSDDLAAARDAARDAWDAAGDAAWDAAWEAAARAAARSARAAAGAAAWEAAAAAARAAARDAAWNAAWNAWDAWYAACDAAWDAQNEELERRLRALLGLQEEAA